MKKVLIIGIGPDYNYPGNVQEWSSQNTKYASNHGASLIARTLMKMFDADYTNDHEHFDFHNHNYELCIICFATHATDWRDVSVYADFIEKLNLPVALFSLGVQDYTPKVGYVGSLHHSLKRILNYVTKTTKYIGVRGFHTASLLYKEGYNNVIPIGCPTLYNGLKSTLEVVKPATFSSPLNVFHRTEAELDRNLTRNVKLLGQDYQDEVVFTNNFPEDELKEAELKKYLACRNGQEVLEDIKTNGVFVRTFDEWFEHIKQSDFIFGARLHGCISGIIQGKPTVMIARDTRVNEIADFFRIPKIRYEDYAGETLQDIYNDLDYSKFNSLYPSRYANFIGFLKLAGIIDYYRGEVVEGQITFSYLDLLQNQTAIFSSIGNLQERVAKIEKALERPTLRQRLKKVSWLVKVYKKIKR